MLLSSRNTLINLPVIIGGGAGGAEDMDRKPRYSLGLDRNLRYSLGLPNTNQDIIAIAIQARTQAMIMLYGIISSA